MSVETETLTDRYVHEVIRRVPARQRQDVAQELRVTIADAIEARDPQDRAEVERAVLTELGDPIQLGTRYADRPQALIGAALYPTYIRLLTVLLCGVLPVLTLVMVAMDVAEGSGLGAIAETALWAIVGVGAQIIAWSTIIFALMERTQGASLSRRESRDWSVERLPELPTRDAGGAGAWASAAAQAVAVGLIVWQQVARPFRTEVGEQIAVLDPVLWHGWIWPVLIGMVGAVFLQLLRITWGGWTRRLVVAYLVVDLLAAVPLVWILYQQTVFNPALLAEVNQGWTTPDEIYTGAAVVVVIVAASGAASRFRQVSTPRA